MNKKWYQSNFAIFILITLFFPVGIFLMWKYSNWNKVVKWILTIFYGMVAIGILNPSTSNKTSTNSYQQKILSISVTNPIKHTSVPTPRNILNGKKLAAIQKVVDGDTVTVLIDGKSETIRVIGINSPESVDPRKPVECFGLKASQTAEEQLNSSMVQLETDTSQGDRDKYGRLLRYVWMDDGVNDFGALMIKNGYAYEYTFNTPYKYQTKYKLLQKDAENTKKGLWADDACITPIPTSNIVQPTSQSVQNNTNSTLGTSTTTSGGDKDCKDFSSQAEAQAYYNSKGGSAENNVDRLDGNDHDGKVCESLP